MWLPWRRIWTGAALGRLAYLQLFRYSEYYSRAQHQQRLIVDVGASRAEIFDRNMNPLAMSVPVDSAFAVPSEIADPDMVARLIGKVLDVPLRRHRHAALRASHSFAWIARKLPPEKADRIAAMNLRGIYFQREGGRFYPKRELAAHVLGYVDIDEKGLGGIEYSLDDNIRSKPGKMLILADAHRRWYDSNDKAPDTGTSVVLTLDEKIQYIAEKELAQAIQDTHAKSGTVIVENPNSGELLAVANWPTFNPNAAKDSPPDARMDRAASSLYEPGSVFKIVTLSAAIDQGVTNPDEVDRLPEWRDLYRRPPHSRPQGVRHAHRFANPGDIPAMWARSKSACVWARPNFMTTFARSVSASPPAWTCRAKAAESFAAWKIGRRFRSVRFPWGRKLA